MPPEIWFQPSSNPDTLTLWDTPSAWAAARRKISAYLFWDAMSDPLPPGVSRYAPFGTCIGPNYETRNAYSQCTAAQIAIGIEGAIELTDACAWTAASVIDMDWTLARISPSWDHTDADLTRVANAYKTFCDTIHGTYPSVQIGDIEGFLFFTPTELGSWIDRCASVGAPLPWLSLDVRWQGGHVSECQALQAVCAARNTPLHVYINPGEVGAESVASDQVYFEHAYAAAQVVHDNMPGVTHLVLASWYNVPDSLRVTPANLPQSGLYTHTKLILDVAALFNVPDRGPDVAPAYSTNPDVQGEPALAGVYLEPAGAGVITTTFAPAQNQVPVTPSGPSREVGRGEWRGLWRGIHRGMDH